jgi:putative transposase
LNGVYTQLFNKYHGRNGHLFQGRYKAILIQKDSHLPEVCRYEVLNPVRAGMVATPDAWKWSSYLATAGKTKPHPCLTTDWVLGQFSGKRRKAEREYRQHVTWGIGEKTIWTEVRGQALLGEDDFVSALTDHLKKHKDIRDIPRNQRYSTRPELSKLLPSKIISDQRKLKRKLTEAVEKYGYHQSQIARHLSVHRSTISRWLREYEIATKET